MKGGEEKMWYAIIGMGTFMICLLISLLCLRSEIEYIKESSLWFLESRLERKILEAKIDIERSRKIREGLGNNIYQRLDRQIRFSERYGIFEGRDIPIREALRMLFSYLKLKIQPGDDVKIVKIK